MSVLGLEDRDDVGEGGGEGSGSGGGAPSGTGLTFSYHGSWIAGYNCCRPFSALMTVVARWHWCWTRACCTWCC